MKYSLHVILLFFLSGFLVSAQERKSTYIEFDVTASITGNPDKYENENYNNHSNAFFIPNGIGSKLGYGIHHKKWITLGVHSGLDWKTDDKLVAIPIYANLGINPKISSNQRISLQLGYGKGFALGRGNLNGEYKKVRLGISADDLCLFIEISNYDFKLNNQLGVSLISLGLFSISF